MKKIVVKYKHVISLGWFCSVAEEMEKLGLRNASYPFDWILSDLKTVYDMIEGQCIDYLDAEQLVQDDNVKNIYYHRNRKCLAFIHDINPYQDYNKEIEKAEKKYSRRLERLRHDMKEPCIFLRYIMDNEEYQTVFEKRKEIVNWVKSYHSENQIIFIANEDFGKNEEIWSVRKDSDDSVARQFMMQLPDLKEWLLKQEYDFSISDNRKWYKRKQRKRALYKYPNKILNKWRQLLFIVKTFGHN